ncbi:hypothetical protein Zmor_028350 [Zophobas morio]|uniref:Pre-C2HC domain-containing protein n=1 Tax=Zophobas morio TaxID=2755281 RepID=A0AA38HPT4_9CUCU|nr:hypothetical protein Zmor_028350 [Zophobas morio]
MEVNDNDSELSSTPPEVVKAAKETSLRLLPQKSRKKYQAMYQAVMDWRTNKKVKSFSENVFLAYLILKNNPKRSVSASMAQAGAAEDAMLSLSLFLGRRDQDGGSIEEACEEVSRMNRRDRPMSLVLAELTMCKKADIFEVKTLCGLSVKVEKPHKPKNATQCHRCQRFHHSQRHCRAKHHCVKCGAGHQTSDCQLQGMPQVPQATATDDFQEALRIVQDDRPQDRRLQKRCPTKATPKPKAAPVPKKVVLTARQQADFQLQKIQLMTAIAAAKDSQSMAEKMAAFLPLLFKN